MESSIPRSCDFVKDLKEKMRISGSSSEEHGIPMRHYVVGNNVILKHINENISNRRKESIY